MNVFRGTDFGWLLTQEEVLKPVVKYKELLDLDQSTLRQKTGLFGEQLPSRKSNFIRPIMKKTGKRKFERF